MLAVGVDPALAYPALVRGALMDGNLEYTLAAYIPTLGMAVAFAIPLRAGSSTWAATASSRWAASQPPRWPCPPAVQARSSSR